MSVGAIVRHLLTLSLLVLPGRPAEKNAGATQIVETPYTLAHGEMIAVLQGLRPALPRLAGGFSYALPTAIRRVMADPTAGSIAWRLVSVVARIENDLAAARTPERLAAMASLCLVRQQPERAEALLQEAQRAERSASVGASRRSGQHRTSALEAGSDPRIQSDLVAAGIERYELESDPFRLAEALETAERAFRGGLLIPELAFNRALVLEQVGLFKAAEEAWRKVGATGSEWSPEALLRAKGLAEQRQLWDWSVDRPLLLKAAAAGNHEIVQSLVKKWNSAAQVLAEEEVLGALAGPDELGATVPGRRADRHPGSPDVLLRVAGALGAALAASGDSLVQDSVALVSARSGTPEFLPLAAAQAQYLRGRRLQVQGQTAEAERVLADASSRLAREGSPLRWVAEHRRWSAVYQQTRYREAATGVEAMMVVVPEGFVGLHARLSWLRGLIHMASGEISSAIESYERAMRLFESIEDAQGIAATEDLIAESYETLGALRQAWRHLHRALLLRPQIADPSRQSAILARENWFQRAGMWATSLLFVDRVLAEARGHGAQFPVWARIQRARIETGLDDDEGALRDLVVARRELARAATGAIGKRLLADMAGVQGLALLRSDPRTAERKIREALRYFSGAERSGDVVDLSYALARCLLRSGRRAAALAALERARDHEEKLYRGLRDRKQRVFRLNQAQPLFEDLVRLAWTTGDFDAAFRFADLSRTLEPVAATTGVGALRMGTPRTVALFEFQKLGTELGILLLREGRVQPLLLGPVETERVLAAISEVKRLATSRAVGRDWMPPLETLFEMLMKGFLPQLGGVETLVFVPSRELAGLPFGALRDRARGRHLLEDFRIVVAPSASSFLEDRPQVSDGGTVLAVGATAIDPALSFLAPLPEAAREAMAVAATTPGSIALVGAEANRRRVLDIVGRFETVHLAMHAVVNTEAPGLSFLALSPSGDGQSGTLFADEIEKLSLPATRLVVLSGCETAEGQPSLGGFGLASAFLAAGVPAVVATLWRVDDRAALDFSVAFHEARGRGRSASAALREAQLLLLDRSPADWAAFELIGSSH